MWRWSLPPRGVASTRACGGRYSCSACDATATGMQTTEYAPIEPRGSSLLIAWQLAGRHVLIVGGGDVAAGRFVHAKCAGAHVTVMAPRLGEELAFRHEHEHAIDEYICAPFSSAEQLTRAGGQLYDMVLTAIDDAALSRQICVWCRERRIPVNVADVPPECDFYFGSVVRRGPLQVLVSTGGQGPRLARQLRQRIEGALPPEVSGAIERVGTLRRALRKVAPDADQGAARMAWMSGVCDAYSLEQLAALDDAAISRLLAVGWKRARVPRYSEVQMQRRSLSQRVYAALSGVASAPALGFIAGAGMMWIGCALRHR